MSRRPSWWRELVPVGKGRRRRTKHATFGVTSAARRVGRLELPLPAVRFPGRRLARRYRRF